MSDHIFFEQQSQLIHITDQFPHKNERGHFMKYVDEITQNNSSFPKSVILIIALCMNIFMQIKW